jgi:DeoR/GlpR family transcriptional regulator of sugar metabolism
MANLTPEDDPFIKAFLDKLFIPLVARPLVMELIRWLRKEQGTSPEILTTYDRRFNVNVPAKKQIARQVANLLDAHNVTDNVVLDSGTVTFFVAQELRKRATRGLSTNSIAIISDLANSGFTGKCHAIPGTTDSDVMAFTGPSAGSDAREKLTKGQTTVPKHGVAVLGLRAFGEAGIAEDTASLVEFQRALFEHADKLIIVAQGEKFAKQANHSILDANAHDDILERRCQDKSVWLVHSEPTAPLSAEQRFLADRNLQRLKRLLPDGHSFHVPGK